MSAEEKYIAKVGRGLFAAEMAKAALVLRADSRLVGLDRIRTALAREMALRKLGFTARPFKVPLKDLEKPTQEMQDICDAHLRNHGC
jgi:hypothetical protein